ncbi:putative HTH-type transcriptional regulator DegA [uncultured spirochete]|jgi:LacI family repressor for deo operon, udp, cdd, tsx, nupC, and nupG|uniref:Putative HTH-type transcriptional regulator DegA n=1 Tax=uncultured spirochete TaxID=156406 RepID=A0A3P3XM86_9SPIR|nr:putative HTH-type transcriptional regulator DegA [uncultured spirochete]
MASIHDVAHLAGVSVATVSRVLNSSGSVTDATRAKVRSAMQRLGYTPNPSARTLRNNRTGLLALITPEIINPYFAAVASGVQDMCRKSKYQLILCNTGGDESIEISYLDLLSNKQVDGIIIAPPGTHTNPKSDTRIQNLLSKNYPIVMIGKRFDSEDISCDIVTTNTAIGTREAMRHILDGGHSRIAYLGGPNPSIAKTRLATFRSSLSANGLIIDENLIFQTNLTLEDGYNICKKLLDAAHRPTALFAVNDMVAIGAMIALQESGVEIPTEMIVVGFDDIPLASMFRPSLSTVVQPKYDLGHIAAERLIARIEGLVDKFETISLPTHLVIRESSMSQQKGMMPKTVL